MAKKKKGVWVRLISVEKTGTFYVAKKTTDAPLEVRKYDQKIRRHVTFKEAKMK